MRISEWLLPKEKIFFDLLGEESLNVVRGAELLHSCVSEPNSSGAKIQEIKEVERKGDKIVHEIYEKLIKSFITPIDHEDIGRLATLYDDVLDLTYATANRVHLYKISKPTDTLLEFADITLKCVGLLNESFGFMKKLKADKLSELLIDVHRLEEAADELLNESVAKLFEGKDPVMIIKLKEVYETFEAVTDGCEDVATLIRDIAMKNG